MCGSVSLFAFVTPEVPRGSRANPLSLLCPLFIHLVPPSFLYTHSSSPPSLLAQPWMAPSLWWVTDEWSSSLKSRVTARPVKREEMPDKRGPREKGRRKEGGREREKMGVIHSTRDNVKRRASIKSERDGGRMCVAQTKCGSESVRCIFALAPCRIWIVVLNMQKARIAQVGNEPKSRRSDMFLEQAFCTTGRLEAHFMGPLFFHANGHAETTDCLRDRFLEAILQQGYSTLISFNLILQH